MHTAIILKVGVLKRILKKYMMQLCYLIRRIRLQSCICLGTPGSHIIHSRDFPFLTQAVFVATLLTGMKFCVSYVVATVGLYM